ncbi:MAG: MmcQ/YjbR family DNA-binding protein [Devosia sp.]
MASADDVRRLAMELEGTTENAHFDRAAFKVARIYATLSGDGKSLNLKLMPDEQEFRVMMAPALFSPIPNAWGKQGWTSVDVEAIGTAELREALRTAWEHGRAKSPKKR